MVRTLGRVVVPGEEIAVIEEFFPGSNTYRIDGEILSKILGRVEIDLSTRTINVNPFKTPFVLHSNDIVYGLIDSVRDTIAFVKIFYLENRENLFPVPFSGILHILNVSSNHIRGIFEAYAYGDIIRAWIMEEGGPPYVLSTRGREFGVIYARCPNCMNILKRRGFTLYCSRCKRNVKKKTSLRYVIK